LTALSYAILAPNPHNRQPWVADLREPGKIHLLCDLNRRLPETDPFDRQILIGFGCFVELLDLAARQAGFATAVALFPQGLPSGERLDAKPVATITFTPGGQADALAQFIGTRRSTKQPFDMARPVPADVLQALRDAGASQPVQMRAVDDAALCARLRALTFAGHEREVTTPPKLKESIDLMRIGGSEIAQYRDGISLGGPLMAALSMVGMISREQIADPQSSAFKQGMDRYRTMLNATPAYLIVTTPDNSRGAQVAAGRAYVRANLKAAQLGVAMHPVSQLLQEYPEIADLKAQFESAVGVAAPARVQMLARVGYGPQVEPSPRRSMTSFVSQ
jgi:nitroreductase